MKLIAGLGNPGEKYLRTRHNIGFMIVDELARSFNVKIESVNDFWSGVFVRINDEDVYIMKPLTYMNRSGEAIGDFIYENEIPLENLFIVTDDFNLSLGTIRVRAKGSDGGHNGLADISFCLQTEEFPRMRVGIGISEITKVDYVDFVLGDFTQEEIKIVDELMPVYCNCIKSLVTEPILNVMTDFNKSHINL